jgi:hypothetical protein
MAQAERLAKGDGMRSLGEFAGRRLVECPVCSGRASITRIDRLRSERLVCPCGARRESRYEPLVGYAPWLRVETRWGNLGFDNEEHLLLIRALVAAKLRERRADPVTGWNGRSHLARLPAWAKSRKNRAEILRAIDRVVKEELGLRHRARRNLYEPWEQVRRKIRRRVEFDLRHLGRPERYGRDRQ